MIVLLTQNSEWGHLAADIANGIFGDDVENHLANRDDPLPDFPVNGDTALLSILAYRIVPEPILKAVKLAINFHSGTTSYPGNTPYNFAIYENAEIYGAVCHHMVKKVDAGPIIAERTFRVSPHETVYSLRQRSILIMFGMFNDICEIIARGETLPVSESKWCGPTTTLADLNELRRITTDMNPEEIERRRRAATYPGFPGIYRDT